MRKLEAPKIVALLPARNEAPRLAFCLRALARYADAIVYLDDCSEDDSVTTAESLARECRVEKIIRKSAWHRDEPGDRNAMLEAGREMGGTHFVVLDADEAFTANCQQHGFLRQMICALRPGDRLAMTWIQLWRSLEHYRFDDSVWTWNTKEFAFCDNGRCRYASGFIHTPRVPQKLSGKTHALPGYQHGVLHFQFVNWANLLVKQAWYRCLERVRDPGRPAASINELYAPSKDERDLRLRPVPSAWFAGYDVLSPAAFAVPDSWRVRQILGWFEQYGRDRFVDLDIWDVPWDKAEQGWAPAAPAAFASFNASDPAGLMATWRAEVIELQSRNRWAEMRDLCLHVLREAPDDMDAMVALGRAQAALGESHAARWEFIKAAARHPNPENTLARMAEQALRTDERAEFDVRFRQVMESSRETRKELKVLARLCARKNRLLKAGRLYCKLAPFES